MERPKTYKSKVTYQAFLRSKSSKACGNKFVGFSFFNHVIFDEKAVFKFSFSVLK